MGEINEPYTAAFYNILLNELFIAWRVTFPNSRLQTVFSIANGQGA